ncbi:MAG: hypothetical protein ACQEWM_10175 [Actinomycetota bacterium]
MTRRFGVPLHVELDGDAWTVERAWPPRGDDPRIPLEARSRGRVRGGHWSEQGGVELLAPDDDAGLAALGAIARVGTVVAHRPGRRAVVRLDDGSGFAKVVARGRAGRVLDAHARGAAFGRRFRVPEVGAHAFPPTEVVRFTPIGGRTVAELGADPHLDEAAWGELWRAWAHHWPDVVVSPDAGLPTHDAADEARVMADWAARVGDFETGCLAERLRATAAALAAELAALPPVAPVLAHRDLHDTQLLWSRDEGIGVLDLDTSALADPALDLGNLSAHVDLAVAQGGWSRARAAVAEHAIARAAAELGVTADRLAVWRAAARFRVACVHRIRPRWRDRAGRDLWAYASRSSSSAAARSAG